MSEGFMPYLERTCRHYAALEDTHRQDDQAGVIR
jgi:hypothetical protein